MSAGACTTEWVAHKDRHAASRACHSHCGIHTGSCKVRTCLTECLSFCPCMGERCACEVHACTASQTRWSCVPAFSHCPCCDVQTKHEGIHELQAALETLQTRSALQVKLPASIHATGLCLNSRPKKLHVTPRDLWPHGTVPCYAALHASPAEGEEQKLAAGMGCSESVRSCLTWWQCKKGARWRCLGGLRAWPCLLTGPLCALSP